MKTRQLIIIGLSVTLGAGAVGAWAQSLTRGGTSLTPRLDPFSPSDTLDVGTWRVTDAVPIDRVTPSPVPFTPPAAVRPPFFPSPRSPYFPGPR